MLNPTYLPDTSYFLVKQQYCAGGGKGSGVQAGALSSLGDAARALRRAVRSVPELRILDTDAPQIDQFAMEGEEWVPPVLVAGLTPLTGIREQQTTSSVATNGATHRKKTVRSCTHHSALSLKKSSLIRYVH